MRNDSLLRNLSCTKQSIGLVPSPGRNIENVITSFPYRKCGPESMMWGNFSGAAPPPSIIIPPTGRRAKSEQPVPPMLKVNLST
jgi:hypothetical protein